MGAAMMVVGAISTALRGVTPCVAGWIGIGSGIVATGQSLASAYNNFTQPGGDPITGILDMVQAAVTFKVQVASSCFTGRMLMQTAQARSGSMRSASATWCGRGTRTIRTAS